MRSSFHGTRPHLCAIENVLCADRRRKSGGGPTSRSAFLALERVLVQETECGDVMCSELSSDMVECRH